ncbi:MAG: polymer-forming cytoskeletal protein [Deltaproteobacteria bacterium]|nr:polymer-forming cytoskeletal protein [Deltaproteobacteria bacterium]RLB88527.1 MAG: polymer-forming cytoskeletal protein [Deltaproteobacteria bacterium]RLB95788.1 MAG: polymer-forming cytoskeletal protein [Deltaproteobacteria bacterium]RLC12359.1 MAG: polymer-forming cytoskeletal protein [Deltaproteobacteria bacterium]
MAEKSKGLSIIAKDLSIEGTIQAKGKLIIAGKVAGSLVGDIVVTVEGSHVSASADVGNMIIGGSFEGDITVHECLHILNTGDFSGKIFCKTLMLEAGGKLNANVKPLALTDAVSPAAPGLAATEEEVNT